MELQKKYKKVEPSVFTFGKIPPQSKELESAILGAIMLQKDAFETASEIMKHQHFYVDAHQLIFKAMERLTARRMPIDMMTVVEQLITAGELEDVGGAYFISKLTNDVVSAANIQAHCRIVLQKYLSRELIRIGSEIVNNAYNDSIDIFDMLDTAETDIGGIRAGNIKEDYKSLQSIATQNIIRLEVLRQKDESITGVASDFNDLDMVTCGWQPTDLVILAARPSVGKTAFALTLARNAAKTLYQKYLSENKINSGIKPPAVGFFSLEMSNNQLVNRVLASESDVWLWRFKNGKINDANMAKIYEGAERLNSCRIFLDDTAGLSIAAFKNKAKQMVKKENVQIIFVDYLQLMTVPEIKFREQVISTISQGLKNTAKELNIPIIALSQLSRDIEKSKGKEGKREPQLSDIRESGAIEQDADMVMFLYKPSEDETSEDAALKDIFYLKIAKHRSGSLEKFMGKFTGIDQKHHYLNIIDGSNNLIEASSWKPVNNTASVLDNNLNKGGNYTGEEDPF